MNYVVIFIVSFVCILLELFLTCILGLKAWNHVVYTVIPFAILGYGIGANILLIKDGFFLKLDPRRLLGLSLIMLSLITIFVFVNFISLPIQVDYLLNAFKNFDAIGMLLKAYILFMLPFTVMGFVVVYLFRKNHLKSHWLYFVDLIGASLGAGAFFFMIHHFEVFHSILILSIVLFFVGSYLWLKKLSIVLMLLTLLLLNLGFKMPEPLAYSVDPQKGWEWIPGYFSQQSYDLLSSHWQPLGRTDLYRMKGQEFRSSFFYSTIPFQVNIEPHPEFAYFVTNFLSGTPVYRYEVLGRKGTPFKTQSFSTIVELPYLLLKNPKVFVIGAGGGRDIFMARTHGAKEVIGAEVNTEIVRNMSKGGAAYIYSGKIYDQGNIYPVDARHLVKTQPSGKFDYIILNGVDTFNGLSSGAYAYAESYLYTKEALKDYLRIMNDKGVLCFFRWLFKPPRETLRLEAMAFQALKEMGIEHPWDNVLIFDANTWGLTLVRKTPFTAEEIEVLSTYASERKGRLLFPNKMGPNDPFRFFNLYAQAYRDGKSRQFMSSYPYDISVVTDDKPFFYKYYKFYWDYLINPTIYHHTGPIIFWTQCFVLLQAVLFITLFIFVPLGMFKRVDSSLSGLRAGYFIAYFACLGLGYMFVEIPLMQKFVLFLGSPIYSISVVLAGLLFWTGMGSYLLPLVRDIIKKWSVGFIRFMIIGVLFLIFSFLNMTLFLEGIMAWPLWARILLIIILLAPAGCFLGLFFPTGLKAISKRDPGLMPWAWGINCGFSVLGSMLAIIIAQFMGFNFVLLAACIVYIMAVFAYGSLG